jgi:hypothetical protein
MSLQAALACDILKQRWRRSNPKTVLSWKNYLSAAFQAVLSPGKVFKFGKVKYVCTKDKLGNKYLLCRLPSGRVLHYFDPRIRSKSNKFSGKNQKTLITKTVDSNTKQWVDQDIYGGLLCENITQAVCRDLLAEALVRLYDKGFKLVLQVHDECAAEVPLGTGEANLKELIRLMEVLPTWAKGFPVKATGWHGVR